MKRKTAALLTTTLILFSMPFTSFSMEAMPDEEAIDACKKGDCVRALESLHEAAGQGNVIAQRNLGLAYCWSLPYCYKWGKPKNDIQAAEWFRRAGGQGDSASQAALGELYYYGDGVSKDHTQAAEWLSKAAQQGNRDAQYLLGFMYDKGQGVPQDSKQAEQWYRKAAEQGSAAAQNNLGAMYYKGQGVTKNHVQALEWFRKAAEQGNTQAKNSLNTLKFEQTQKAASQDNSDSIESAVATCIEDHIVTGQYFLIDSRAGTLNLKTSSLKLNVACQNEMAAWINACEYQTGNSQGCVRTSMANTQMLLRDAWNHRGNLKKWRAR